MKRTLITSADGTATIQSEDFGESYHSLDGAVQESRHVYIRHGLLNFLEINYVPNTPITILEVGFGTGLNAFLTILEQLSDSRLTNSPILFETVELYPLKMEEWSRLNYYRNEQEQSIFEALHSSKWDIPTPITNSFTLFKRKEDILTFEPSTTYDIVYFDPFSAATQPKLWSEAIFSKIRSHLHQGSILATYSSKGIVKQALRNTGFSVTRKAGVGHKRHIVIANAI